MWNDDLSLTYPIIDNLGKEQNATFITEPQLYFVFMRSGKSKGYAPNSEKVILKGFKGG